MFNDDAPLSPRAFRSVLAVVAAGALASIVAIVVTRRFLYADSSGFLLGMWESGSFFIPNRGRWFGFAVSQWMPVGAMKLGVTDPGVLATLFGVNLWMNPVLAIVVAWRVSGRSREVTLVTLLCVLFLFQTTYMVLDNEANVFFWLAATLFILTLRSDFSYWALLLLVPILFSHAVAVLALGPCLAVLLLRRDRYLRYYGQTRFWSLVASTAVVCGIVVYLVLGPEAGPNRTYFLQGALSLPGSPSLVLTTVAFGTLTWHALRPERAALWSFYAATGLLAALPFMLPELIWPFYHYRARILNAVLAFVLFLYLHARVHGGLEAPRWLAGSRLIVLAVVVFCFQGKVTWEWHRHVTLFRAELAQVRGLEEFPSRGTFAEPRSRQFSWSWASPTRSVVFQAMEDARVRALMLNEDTTGWEPFDPRQPRALPDLSRIGASYVPELTGISP